MKREAVLDGLVVKLPQLDINTIGAGGGSIARWDAGGALLLGRESAGATPGPACYGRGGTAATVTDANVVLGRLGASQNLGRSLEISAAAAAKVVEALGAVRGVSATAMADGIVRLAVAKMAAAIHEVSVARGVRPAGICAVAVWRGRAVACLPGGRGAWHHAGGGATGTGGVFILWGAMRDIVAGSECDGVGTAGCGGVRAGANVAG